MNDTVVYNKHSMIDIQRFDELFAILEQSFPTTERRDRTGHLAEFSEERFNSVCYIPDKLMGFLNYWDFDDFIYIEHFAVSPELRGQGTGSALMSYLKELTDGRKLVLEAEPPTDSGIAARRVAFYERLGFKLNSYNYIQPPLIKGEKPIPLVIMSYPAPLSPDEYSMIRERMYRDVYKCKNDRSF
ncbi:MAG: GNAT family N-acetyltransferase [Ruminococcaceae bacterium]|nr:GNAT family N-acetyltransferase [Oscillospiraceae bacterium]